MAQGTGNQNDGEEPFFPPRPPPPYQGHGINNSDSGFPEASIVSNPPPYEEPDPGPETPLLRRSNSSERVRQWGFIRKIYGIMMAQIAITAGAVLWVMKKPRVMSFIDDHFVVLLCVSIAVYVVTIIILMLYNAPKRRVPYNYLSLLLLTLSLATHLGVLSSLYNGLAYLIVAGIAFLVVLSLGIMTFMTNRIEFNLTNGCILSACLTVVLFGIASPYFPYEFKYLIFCATCVCCISFGLVLDSILIEGGDHRFTFLPNEYVYGTLCLYVDSIYVFSYALLIVR